MPADQLAEKIGLSDVVSVGAFVTVWDAVMQRAEPGDRIVIFGSFFTVGAAYSEFGDSVRTSGDG
jgi:folylpolyglutamate synthase/dihydropteroate synthase